MRLIAWIWGNNCLTNSVCHPSFYLSCDFCTTWHYCKVTGQAQNVRFKTLYISCFRSLLPSNDFTYQTNVAGNEPFHSWWGWLVRCETTKMFNEVALKQIHSLRLRFLHNITWLDRRRKKMSTKQQSFWGGGGLNGVIFVSSGVIDWPLFYGRSWYFHKKRASSRELPVKIMDTENHQL